MYRQFYRPLPRNTHPTGTRCIQLTIPDDDDYERALYAQATELTMWMLWERDADKQGTVVAKQWKQAIKSWRHCDGTPSPIIVDESEYEMALCEQLRYMDGKLQALCCGEWQDVGSPDNSAPGGGAQPGAGSGTAAPGECKTYNGALDANGLWTLPSPVNSGDTLAIHNAKGAFFDGASPAWRCPDGLLFFADTCTGSPIFQGGDPIPGKPHMSLIFKIGASTVLPSTDGTVTVPSGIVNEQLVIQVNDDALSDNSGSCTFQVEWCNNQSARWTHVFDFTTGLHGWVPDPIWDGPADAGVWVPGQGIQYTDGIRGGREQRGVSMTITLPARNIDHETINYDYAVGTVDSPTTIGGFGFALDATPVWDYTVATAPAGAPVSLAAAVSETGVTTILAALRCDSHPSGGNSGNALFRSISLSGDGADPFAGF